MITYTVALTERAEQEAENAYLWLSGRVGPERAARWYEALLQEMHEALSSMPGRFAISEEGCSAYPGTVVQVMRFGRGRSVYRVLFHVIALSPEGTEGLVRVLHIRHGAMGPLGEEQEPT